MKIFGYQKESEDLIELQEISFQADIKELDKMIKFLQSVKEEHGKVVLRTKEDMCHSHFRDWDGEWLISDPDIIVVTKK